MKANRQDGAPLSRDEIGERIGAILNPQSETPEKDPNEPQELPAEEIQPELTPEHPEDIPQSEPEAPEAPAEEAPAQEDAPTYELPDSLDELANQLGIEKDKFEQIKVRVKIDGVESNVQLRDAIASFQTQKHVTQKSMAVSDKEKKVEALTQELEQERAKVTNYLSELSAVITLTEDQLVADYKQIDWKALQSEDPARWAAMQVEFGNRQRSIEQAKHQFQERLQNEQRDWEQKQARQVQDRLQYEREALFEKLPEWRDAKVRDSERVEIQRYLKDKLGFTDNDINNLVDHRQIVAARKAWLFDRAKDAKPMIQKKIANLPPVMRGGRPKSSAELDAAKKADMRARLNNKNLSQKERMDIAASLIGETYEL